MKIRRLIVSVLGAAMLVLTMVGGALAADQTRDRDQTQDPDRIVLHLHEQDKLQDGSCLLP